MTLASIVKPTDTLRTTSVLYRFAEGGRGDYGALRTQLLEQGTNDLIPGSLMGWASTSQTRADMKLATFCVW